MSFNYNDLEPYIDGQTMELHHSKHHAGYVKKLNSALENYPDLAAKPIEDLLKNLDNLPQDIKLAVRNNGGGHYNHSLFWRCLSPQGGGEPVGQLLEAIKNNFGDFNNFKQEFSKTAEGVFGSGWVWLVEDSNKKLAVAATPNQDSPISHGLKPLLCLDVWEHAYYLKYQNRRPEYIQAWWNVVNWQEAERLLES